MLASFSKEKQEAIISGKLTRTAAKREKRREGEEPMKHTPGLWNKDRNMIEDSSGQVIAEVSYKQSGYVQGNAHLIAAAPELLEACKEMLRFYDGKELIDRRRPLSFIIGLFIGTNLGLLVFRILRMSE